MARKTRFHVLLITRVPEMHRDVIRSFRLQGAQVFVARRASHAVTLLSTRPEMVLVDLALGSCLSPLLVRALNDRKGSTRVVALHAGSLELVGESATDLNVHGFFRLGDLDTFSPVASTPALSSFAIH